MYISTSSSDIPIYLNPLMSMSPLRFPLIKQPQPKVGHFPGRQGTVMMAAAHQPIIPRMSHRCLGNPGYIISTIRIYQIVYLYIYMVSIFDSILSTGNIVAIYI